MEIRLLLGENQVIQRGRAYIQKQLLTGTYGLSCFGLDSTARFSNEKGHVFSAYFIADALIDSLGELERSLLLVRLMSEEVDGHWGYSPRGYYKGDSENPCFVDADDTAFALRTYRKLGIFKSQKPLLRYYRKQSSTRFRKKKHPDGFVTFATNRTPSLSLFPDSKNNFDLHPEVNANVFNSLLDTDYESLINPNVIVMSQSSEGYWHSYFYPGKYYATFHFLELLARVRFCEEQKEKGLTFISESQNQDGSWGEPGNPYETALALKSLGFHKIESAQSDKAIVYLIENQEEDGSWSTENVIWKFHERANDVWISRDTHKTLVTSLCISALKQFSSPF